MLGNSWLQRLGVKLWIVAHLVPRMSSLDLRVSLHVWVYPIWCWLLRLRSRRWSVLGGHDDDRLLWLLLLLLLPDKMLFHGRLEHLRSQGKVQKVRTENIFPDLNINRQREISHEHKSRLMADQCTEVSNMITWPILAVTAEAL